MGTRIAIPSAAPRLTNISTVNPYWANTKPPLRPKPIAKYSDRNREIWGLISRFYFRDPARMPNTKNKMAGSKKREFKFEAQLYE